jgi:hypothetical protein
VWSFDTLASTVPDPADLVLSRYPLLSREWHGSKNGTRNPGGVYSPDIVRSLLPHGVLV